MAATRRLSPSATLLRQSRLFSLPPPLPPLFEESAGANSVHTSDTATVPYPTHQALQTTQASLSRGDWGLKRAIPAKGIKTRTNPTIRVKEVDSIDHITDYASAADHVNTLRKWQEMHIAISELHSTRRASNPREQRGTSVFESAIDSTDKDVAASKRWKFDGPWIAGQSRGEFLEYLVKQVGPRKEAFRRFLRVKLKEKKTTQRRRIATEKGEPFHHTPTEISEEELDLEIVRLRHDPSPIELWALVWHFLDLPGTAPDVESGHVADRMLARGLDKPFEPDRGPPSTHPSAGLSYLRATAHVPNHPVLGPVASNKPIEARLIQKNRQSGGLGSKQGHSLLGVGGVVAEDLTGQLFREPSAINVNQVGGEKVWVDPQLASISASGTIQLKVAVASKDACAIWHGHVDPAAKGQIERAEMTSAKLQNLSRDTSTYLGFGNAEERKERMATIPTRPSLQTLLRDHASGKA